MPYRRKTYSPGASPKIERHALDPAEEMHAVTDACRHDAFGDGSVVVCCPGARSPTLPSTAGRGCGRRCRRCGRNRRLRAARAEHRRLTVLAAFGEQIATNAVPARLDRNVQRFGEAVALAIATRAASTPITGTRHSTAASQRRSATATRIEDYTSRLRLAPCQSKQSPGYDGRRCELLHGPSPKRSLSREGVKIVYKVIDA